MPQGLSTRERLRRQEQTIVDPRDHNAAAIVCACFVGIIILTAVGLLIANVGPYVARATAAAFD